jgi:hypothetical protein
MQGFTNAKQTFENLLPADQQEASLKEAATNFKK